MLLHNASLPVATRTARIRQVSPTEPHTLVLKQGSRKVCLVCEDATVGEVREYYANQVGASGIEHLEVAITWRNKVTKTYPPDKAALFLVTTDVQQIEFRAPAPAKG